MTEKNDGKKVNMPEKGGDGNDSPTPEEKAGTGKTPPRP